MHIPTHYTVLTNFPGLGFGMAGDPKEQFDDAYNMYSDAFDEYGEARVFLTSFDVETGALESHREVTSDFRDEYDRITEEAV